MRSLRVSFVRFVYRAFIRLHFQCSSFVPVSCVRFLYRAFVSFMVRFSYRSCEEFVRLLAFVAYCKLMRSRICSSLK